MAYINSKEILFSAGLGSATVPSGTLEIKENGTHNVSEFAIADVKIKGEDSPLPIEISTESEMNALLSTAEVGSIYKYKGTTGTYENGALYVVEESE